MNIGDVVVLRNDIDESTVRGYYVMDKYVPNMTVAVREIDDCGDAFKFEGGIYWWKSEWFTPVKETVSLMDMLAETNV